MTTKFFMFSVVFALRFVMAITSVDAAMMPPERVSGIDKEMVVGVTASESKEV